MKEIDIVVLWVDGSDQEWLKEKSIYSESKINIEEEAVRFRDWGLLKYWFRGIEKFAPWVRKVHFITYGHLPEWLNTENDNLNIVNHKDYIPEKYLPTFSSHCIEFNIHRIKDLSDKFVLFNDDVYLTAMTSAEDFFINDKPVDQLITSALSPLDDNFSHILYNNLAIINRFFSKEDLKKLEFSKKYNLKYGKNLIKTITTLPYIHILGFDNHHLAQPFLKETFEKLWDKVGDELDKTCMNKFRTNSDISQYLFRYWNLMEGNFIPGNKKGRYLDIRDDNIIEVKQELQRKTNKCVTLNDSRDIKEFEYLERELSKAFDSILPEKSKFEK